MIFKGFLKLICGSAIAILSLSCVEKKDSRIADPLYFNLIGFIDSLVSTMDSSSYSLQKEFVVEGIDETKTYSNVDWKKELEHFKECDINSPILRETFEIKTRRLKNGVEVIYIPKNLNESRIELLSVVYDSDNKVNLIRARIVSSTILYVSERSLLLSLSQINNRTFVKGFVIRNKEGLVFRKPSLNQVKATVIFSF